MGRGRHRSPADDTEQPRGTATKDGAQVIEPGDSLSLDMVTAALRADSADVAVYARVLTESLGDALPPGWVTIDRNRTVSDRMRGRPGQVSKITVRMGERVMTLGVQRGAPVAEICREVRGVVLSRQPVPVGAWAEELARALVAHAEENAQTAQALRRLVAGD
jgi:hypothetical protein